MIGLGAHRGAGQTPPLRYGYRHILRAGTLNVRTSSLRQLDDLAADLDRAGVHVTGLQECRRPGFGSTRLDSGAKLVWSGGQRRQHGVGAILAPRTAAALLTATPCPAAPDRLLLLHLHAHPRPLAIVVAYAPTDAAPAEAKDTFWSALASVLASVPRSHNVLVLGDLNAQVGATATDGIMGPHACPRAPPPPGAANAARARPHDHRAGVTPRLGATDNGLRTVHLCATAGLIVADSFFARDPEHTATWRNPNGRSWAAIDHILTSRALRSALMSTMASWTATAHPTDHALLTVDLRVTPRRPAATTRRDPTRHLNWELLADAGELRTGYEQALTERATAAVAEGGPVPDAPSPQWTEAAADLAASTPLEVAAAHLPARRASATEATWLRATGKRAADKQRAAWQRWDSRRRLYWQAWAALAHVTVLEILANASEAAYDRYRIQQRITRRVHRAEREAHRAAVLAGVAHATRGSPQAQRAAWAQLRQLCGIRQPQHPLAVRAADGSAVSGQAAVDTIAATFAAQEAARPPPDTHRAARLPAAIAELAASGLQPPVQPSTSAEEPEPSVAEVQEVTSHLRPGAPGRDSLHPLGLKAGGAGAATLLHRAVLSAWRSQHAPAQWRESVIAPLPKAGDPLNPANRRRIALLNSNAKIYASILSGRIRDAVEGGLLDEQHGFRRGRGTADAQFCVARVIELAAEHGQPVYAGLIDFKQAFDSVDRPTLWAALRAYGAPHHAVDLFADLYADSTSSVRVGAHESAPFPIHAGVRQGCPASPGLFNAYFDLVQRCFLRRCQQQGINGLHFEYRLPGRPTASATRRILHTAFADDLILLCQSLQDLQAALAILHQVAAEWGLVINYAKCEIVVVDPPSAPQTHVPDRVDVPDAGASIAVVQVARYLGWLITADRSASPILQRRLAAAGAAHRQIARALKQPGEQRTRAMLYRTCVVPALTYGIPETCSFSDHDLAPLAVAHNNYLRRLTGLWRRPDGTYYPLDQLTAAAGVPSLQACIDAQRLTRLGHVARMPDSSVVKQLLFATGLVGTGRPTGRPRRVWLDAAKESLARVGRGAASLRGDGWVTLAQDRAAWRALCLRAG